MVSDINNIVRIFICTMTMWLWGGFVYYCVELTYRGYSHPSMFAVGGICFLLLGRINIFLPWSMGLVWQALIGAGIITTVEFFAGLIINIWLGLGVWDYSDLPLNLFGQISLLYSLYWFPLAAVGIWLWDFLRWKLYGEQQPQYSLF